MWFCCCANKKNEDQDDKLGQISQKLKSSAQILFEFTHEEQKIGLKAIDSLELAELVLSAASKGEIQKAKVKEIYQALKEVDYNQVRSFIDHEFFLVEQQSSKYDLNKILIFNLLYSGGEQSKTQLLYSLVEDPNSGTVVNRSSRLIKTIENIAMIVSLIICQIIDSKKRFEKTALKQDFQELKDLYSTNSTIYREFAMFTIDTHLFASLSSKNSHLQREEFFEVMKRNNNLFIKPSEMRKQFTEYVFTHRAAALQNLRPMKKKKKKERSREESKIFKETPTGQEMSNFRQDNDNIVNDSSNSKGTLKSSKKSRQNLSKKQKSKQSSRMDLHENNEQSLKSGKDYLNKIQEEPLSMKDAKKLRSEK